MEKSDNDEGVKKAFMRGVCALNMEAMGVLMKDEHELDASSSPDHKPQLYCNRRYVHWLRKNDLLFFPFMK